MAFQLQSEYKPTGDQPAAIKQLLEGIHRQERDQVLLGVTGSGKTFTVANVVQEINRPTLVLSHNKTLAAQLYGEFKHFFPNNAVEYFISYYDYYQPEAYIPTTDLYIEKDLAINDEIEKLRLSATSALMSGRSDVLVVASVSCIYGIGNPTEFQKSIVRLAAGDEFPRNQLLFRLVDILYNRTTAEFTRGTFRVKGDTVDIFPAYADFAFRLIFWGDEIESIQRIDPVSGKKTSEEKAISIFPANLFVTGKELLHQCIGEIQDDLVLRMQQFENEGRYLEAKRLKERTEFDIEMMRELGFCSGIENYSRYFDRRNPGDRPFCLLDYFPDDFLMIIDESHVTVPQVRAMWGGDRSRKVNLVDYGFRLPAAMDNRPLTFNEFEEKLYQTIYVSATPGEYELRKTEGIVTEQIIRPTGLLDPEIEVRPTTHQIDDFLEEIDKRIKANERVLATTLTKRMAEELSRYLDKLQIKARYIHSEVKVMDRVDILQGLREGEFDVLIGVNLLREGLDLPEVSLVVLFDADKEGFLRNQRSMIQTIGRAARNVNGKVIMYADKMTDSMQRSIDETNRRRSIQMEYNKEHNIEPTTIIRKRDTFFSQEKADQRGKDKYYSGSEASLAADPVVQYTPTDKLEKQAQKLKKDMEQAAKDMDFMMAADLRDQFFEMEEIIKQRKRKEQG